jgi:hypothetical protein
MIKIFLTLMFCVSLYAEQTTIHLNKNYYAKDISSFGFSNDYYKLICINNIIYIDGIRQLAVYIDYRTLKPVRCNLKEK